MKETAFEKFVKDFKNGPYARVDLLFPNDNDVYFSFESKPNINFASQIFIFLISPLLCKLFNQIIFNIYYFFSLPYCQSFVNTFLLFF